MSVQTQAIVVVGDAFFDDDDAFIDDVGSGVTFDLVAITAVLDLDVAVAVDVLVVDDVFSDRLALDVDVVTHWVSDNLGNTFKIKVYFMGHHNSSDDRDFRMKRPLWKTRG